jgi:ring-1,2-phenylacetyl-CoA epoxidase subunit PaaE
MLRPMARNTGAKVEIILDGARRTIEVDAGQDTVLTAAMKAGLDLPYSCAGGMCCTCRCRIVEGAATMDENFSLEPWEIEAGFTLACQARPDTEKLVLDFDAQ